MKIFLSKLNIVSDYFYCLCQTQDPFLIKRVRLFTQYELLIFFPVKPDFNLKPEIGPHVLLAALKLSNDSIDGVYHQS